MSRGYWERVEQLARDKYDEFTMYRQARLMLPAGQLRDDVLKRFTQLLNGDMDAPYLGSND